MSGAVSVGVAVGAAAMAASEVAAVGFTATSIAMTIGAVGAAAMAVGTIANIPALKIAGGALSLVGGVGALAAGAGMFASEGASLASTGAAGGVATDAGTWAGAAATPGAITPAAQDAPLMVGAGQGSTSAVTGTAPAAAPATDFPLGGGAAAPEGGTTAAAGTPANNVINNVSNSVVPGSAPTTETPTLDVTPKAAGATDNVSPASLMEQGDAGNPTLGTTNNPAAPPDPAAAVVAQAGAPGTDASGVTAVSPPGGNPNPYQVVMQPKGGQPLIGVNGSAPTDPFQGAFGKLMQFVDDHPSLALGAISTAGNFLSGALNPKTPAEVGYLKSRTQQAESESNLANVKSAMLSRQLTNMSGPMPVANRVGIMNS